MTAHISWPPATGDRVALAIHFPWAICTGNGGLPRRVQVRCEGRRRAEGIAHGWVGGHVVYAPGVPGDTVTAAEVWEAREREEIG